jgi:signal transduction protein with GAF and PtsI domain
METLMSVQHSSVDHLPIDHSPVDFLHEIGGRLATPGRFHEILNRVVEFVSALVKCDSCLIYILEGEQLVLRASKNAHAGIVDRLKLRAGQGITGWVAERHEPVAITQRATMDPRFQFFHELPEDSYEAFLSVPLMCRGRVVGAINLQHRRSHVYKPEDIRVISAVGFLVGAEIELARMEDINLELNGRLETRKRVERAKGILQRELRLNEEQAYLALQRQSRQKRKPMKEIAEAIILGEELKRENSSMPVRLNDQVPDRVSAERIGPNRASDDRLRQAEGSQLHRRSPYAPPRRSAELRLAAGQSHER